MVSGPPLGGSRLVSEKGLITECVWAASRLLQRGESVAWVLCLKWYSETQPLSWLLTDLALPSCSLPGSRSAPQPRQPGTDAYRPTAAINLRIDPAI
jgi:hypothetical protein